MTVPSLSVTRSASESSDRRSGRLRWAGAMASVPTPVCTSMPSSVIIRPSSAPPASSSCWAISRGAISTTWACKPNGRNALAASRPSRPPPMTTPDRRLARRHRAPARRRGSRRGRRACDRRGTPAGRGRAPAARRHRNRWPAPARRSRCRSPSAVMHGLGGAVDRGRPGRPAAARPVVARVVVAGQCQLCAVPVLGVSGQADAVVGGVGLLGQHGDPPLTARVAGTQRLDEPVTDHAVADDHDVCA